MWKHERGYGKKEWLRRSRLLLLVTTALVALFVMAACGGDCDTTPTNGDEPTATVPAGDGNGNGNGEASAYDKLSAFAGTWTGSWTNSFFDTTATLTIVVTINEDGTAAFSLELTSGDTGTPFGAIPPDMQMFDGTWDENGLMVAVQDDFLGNLSVTITPDGALSAASAEIPALGSPSSLTVEGILGSDRADLTYTLTFPVGDPNDGTVELTKQ